MIGGIMYWEGEIVITPDMDEILPNLLGLENRTCPMCNNLCRAKDPRRRKAGRKLASYAQPAFRPYRLSVVKIGKTRYRSQVWRDCRKPPIDGIDLFILFSIPNVRLLSSRCINVEKKRKKRMLFQEESCSQVCLNKISSSWSGR